MNAFEIQILKLIDDLGLRDKKLLLGVSGGLDSMVLCEVLHNVGARRNLTLSVGYIHHGQNENDYRDRALVFVQNYARSKKIEFHTTTNTTSELKNEASLRSFRYESLENLQREVRADYIVMGHHSDDLLETRMIRLLRGVGPQGLESMTPISGVIFRPLLSVTRKALLTYAISRGLEWLEDPSNSDNEPLRNWLRNKWLPMVEEKRPGALSSLMTSLENLSVSSTQQVEPEFSDGIDRMQLVRMTFRDQRRLLAGYALKSGLSDYSVTHIDEILKRLDSEQKEFTFKLLKRTWHVDTRRIRVESSS